MNSRSSLPLSTTSRTRAAVVGSEYISDPSKPFLYTPKRLMQSTAGGQTFHPHPPNQGNRPFHQTSRRCSLPSPNRTLTSSTMPTHIPDVAVQHKKFPGHWVGQLPFPPTKSMPSTPSKVPVLSKVNHGTSDYLSDTPDHLPARTVCSSSLGHQQGHTTLTRTCPSAAMQQIPSLLPHCYARHSHQQTLCSSTAETDRPVAKSVQAQSSTQKLRTLPSEPVLEESCASSDRSVQSRRSSVDSESYSLCSLSPSMEDLSRLHDCEESLKHAPGRVIHKSDPARVKAPLSNYANTNGIEIDGIVFSLQEAFS